MQRLSSDERDPSHGEYEGPKTLLLMAVFELNCDTVI